jgi:hypothetical protein
LTAGPWLGVDVGAAKKGFDIAVIDARELLELRGGLTLGAVLEHVDHWRPRIVAIDSPRSCAPTGATTRPGERELAKAVCGIRWTPDEAHVRANRYYAWIVEGLALFEALRRTASTRSRCFRPHRGRGGAADEDRRPDRRGPRRDWR